MTYAFFFFLFFNFFDVDKFLFKRICIQVHCPEEADGSDGVTAVVNMLQYGFTVPLLWGLGTSFSDE